MPDRMDISSRAGMMPSSPIRKLAPFADEAKARGIKVYHLNIGQPDIETPECALDSVRSIDRSILEYSPSQGFRSLREKMVSYYSGFGIELDADDITVTTGGSEALLFAFMTCLDPGDEIIVTEPFYANYKSFALSCGAVVKSVKTTIEEGFRLPSVQAFEDCITPRTKAVLICNPNNPTGYLYSREELEQLKDIVLKHNLFLISDEVYREFIYTDTPYVSVLSMEGLEENAILIDSVSKRYSECGIRIGMLVTRNMEFRQAVLKFCQARLSPPLLGQIVARASIDTPKEYLRKVRDEYLSRRDFLIKGLKAIPGVVTTVPEGAFYAMVQLPVEDTDDFCRWCLTDFEYEGATVMMAPGSGFYTDTRDGAHQVRMAYVLKKEELAKALKVLEKALECYNG